MKRKIKKTRLTKAAVKTLKVSPRFRQLKGDNLTAAVLSWIMDHPEVKASFEKALNRTRW